MISIVTCVYNSEKYLDKCFESIKNQSYTDFEVIVVNDGSTDKSQIIIDKYKKNDHRFKSYYQNNSGQAIARNNGINYSKGDYIVFVDSDDEIEENYLKNLSIIIEKNLDFGFSKIKRIFDKKPNYLEKHFSYIHSFSTDESSIYEKPELLTKIMNAPYAKIVRKKFLIDNDIYFYPGKLYEDFLFTQSILLSNPKMMSVNDDSYLYYVHSGTTMTANGHRAFEMLDVFDSVLHFSEKKKNKQIFNDEFEYLALYHIAIGTQYRYFCYKPFSFFSSLKKCRNYLKRNNYTIHNKYIRNSSIFVKLYLIIFYSFL